MEEIDDDVFVAENKVDNAGPIYVGGFLTLYAESPSDERLRLPRETVVQALTDSDNCVIPLNINHDDAATVGKVKLFDTNAGLFCLGCVYSPSFLAIVEKASEKSKLVARGPIKGLNADPVVEYLSAGFPALSLSSCVTAAGTYEPGQRDFFKHVSLCGLGKRRGTLAVYGRDCNWISDRFSALSSQEKDNISKCDISIQNTLDSDPFGSDSYGLLASTVDDGYIAERLCRLRYDKHVLGLHSTETYIKASELPVDGVDSEVRSIIHDDCEDQKESDAMAQPPHGITSINVPGVNAAQNSSLPSDCVYLSRDALLSILSTSARHSGSHMQQSPYTSSVGDIPRQLSYTDHAQGYGMDRSMFGRGYGSQHIYGEREPRGSYDPWRERFDMMDDRYYDRSRYPPMGKGFRERRKWRSPSPDDEDNDDDFDSPNVKRSKGRMETVRKKRRTTQMSDDDLTLPGEKGYPKQSANNVGVANDDISEVKAALNEIRKDIFQIRAAAKSDRVNKDDSGQSVGSSDQKVTESNVEHAEKKHDFSSVAKNELINASCEPMDVEAKRKNDMLEVNKRVFVSLLNKIE